MGANPGKVGEVVCIAGSDPGFLLEPVWVDLPP